MTSSDDTLFDNQVKPRRILPRRGRWSAEEAEKRPRQPAAPAGKAPRAKKPVVRRPNPAAALWAKGEAAARSAQQLLHAGDWDGAANRAYYAVFSAARAALAGVRASLAASKGHATIFRRFDKHLVTERGLDPAFGRPLFGRLGRVRWVADYSNAGVDETTARATLEEMQRFITAIEPFLKKARA
jgi:uncharacterized protein (UPF0332 family)